MFNETLIIIKMNLRDYSQKKMINRLRKYSSQKSLRKTKITEDDKDFFGICTNNQFEKKYKEFKIDAMTRRKSKPKSLLKKSTFQSSIRGRMDTQYSSHSTAKLLKKSVSILKMPRNKNITEEEYPSKIFDKEREKKFRISTANDIVKQIPNLRLYRISHDELNRKGSEEERLEYIKDKLVQKFKLDLKKFMNLEVRRLARIKKFDRKMNKKKEKQKSKDVFNWLHVNTK